MKKSLLMGLCLVFFLQWFHGQAGETRMAAPSKTISSKIVQTEVDPKEVVDRLFINAYNYKLPAKFNDKITGYAIQFEHWKKGELKQTQTTQTFDFPSKNKNPAFFISFASLPSLEVVVMPHADDGGEFRQRLKFAANPDGKNNIDLEDASASLNAFLEISSLEGLGVDGSLILGYQLAGLSMNDSGIGVIDTTKKIPVSTPKDPLLTDLKAYQKYLANRKLDEVSVIVYRLVFK